MPAGHRWFAGCGSWHVREHTPLHRSLPVQVLHGRGAVESGTEVRESGGDGPVERDRAEGRVGGGCGGGEEPGEAVDGEVQDGDRHRGWMHRGGM